VLGGVAEVELVVEPIVKSAVIVVVVTVPDEVEFVVGSVVEDLAGFGAVA
jgi:hypothetical protein